MRTLKAVDAEIRTVRAKIQDSVRDSPAWKVAWKHLDKLLDERNACLKDK